MAIIVADERIGPAASDAALPDRDEWAPRDP